MSTLVTKVPHHKDLLLCGNLNARTGCMVPNFGHEHVADRVSSDPVTCARGKWLIEQLQTWQLQLLNGSLLDVEGAATCKRHNGSSVVDYMAVRGVPM